MRQRLCLHCRARTPSRRPTDRRSSLTRTRPGANPYVSLGVIDSAIGVPIAGPLSYLAMTLVMLRITWQSWNTVPTARILAGNFDQNDAERTCEPPNLANGAIDAGITR